MSSYTTVTAAAELVGSDVRDSILNKLVHQNGYAAETAEHLIDAMFLYLELVAREDLPLVAPFLAENAAENGGRVMLAPSRAIDDAWHQFIIHTKAYAEFCDQLAGRFIHHTPDGVEGSGTTIPAYEALRVLDVEYDPQVWEKNTAWCGCGNCGDCGND